MFRYQLNKKLKEKNQMKRELSACIIQKFNGYELLRNHLNATERKNFIPIDIVYQPTLNEKNPVVCFFAPEISLGYYKSCDKMRKGKKLQTILQQENVIIAITFLLRAQKRCRNICLAVREKLDLHFRLIMEK